LLLPLAATSYTATGLDSFNVFKEKIKNLKPDQLNQANN
jgi:hypothetical protein